MPLHLPSALATSLAIDGALRSLLGTPDAPAGVGPSQSPRPVGEAERNTHHMTEPGTTFAYSAHGAEVFFDLSGHTSTVWFSGPDALNALPAFDLELRRQWPDAVMVTDEVNSGDVGFRIRRWVIQGADGVAVADVRATYPVKGIALSARDLFLVRIYAHRMVAN